MTGRSLVRRAWQVLYSVIVIGALTGPLAAQENNAPGPAAKEAQKAQSTRRGPQRVIEMETMEVVGKGQKPRVYYLIGRGELAFEGLPLERSFVGEIEESVKGPLF